MKRMMINNKIILVTAILVISVGCKKALDINHDPNNPSLSQGTPKLVLPAGVMAAAGKIGGDVAITGGIWGEYVTQSALANQYKNVDQYDIKSGDITLNNIYAILYADGLKNFQFVINNARDAKDWNYFLMGQVMKAYTTELLVDLFDKLPYKEALQGASNLNPHFDDGYSIYVDLLKGLDSALSKDFSASTNSVPGNADLVFGGDMSKWIAFANTLELKMYLRMTNAKPAEAMAGVQKLYNNNATFLTDDAGVFGFTDAPGQDNPLYEQNIRQLNTPNNIRASRTFVSWLKANGDSRILSYFGSANPNSIHQGDFLGTDPAYQTAAVFVEKPTDPVIFISAAESYFLQAEANERYFAGSQGKALYDAGVLAAFSSVGQDGSSYIAPGGVYAYPVAGTLDQKIEAIIVQKWASFPYGVHFIEGYFERLRTGYPRTSAVYSTDPAYVPGQFVISKNSLLPGGQLPKRFVFPDDEVSRNVNTPSQVPETTAVWWAKP